MTPQENIDEYDEFMKILNLNETNGDDLNYSDHKYMDGRKDQTQDDAELQE